MGLQRSHHGRLRHQLGLACVLALGGALLGACADDDGITEPSDGGYISADLPRAVVDPAAAAPLVDAGTRFATDLYAAVAAESDTNLVLSPHSVLVALAMTRVGAVGTTADELDQALHLAGLTDVDSGMNALDQAVTGLAGERVRLDGSAATLELRTANALWGQAGLTFAEPFLATLADSYGAGMRVVDYVADAEAARRDVNAWVAEQTAERIPELLPAGSVTGSTRLILTNAVYLLAPWEWPFDQAVTEPAPFTLLDEREVEVDLMRQTEELAYAAVEGVRAIELPYVGREVAMVVLVPDPGTFASVEASFDVDLLDRVVDALEPTEVRLGLPRFEFRTQAGLNTALRALGVEAAFDPDLADFSGMTTDQRLFVSEVVHEAFIAVDEEGTEAAAATAVVMGETAAPAPPVELEIDRPFLFVLRDRGSGAVLFLGRVLDPTA
ncbi:MAG: serpin family protein [Acidimicrobiales bacterium]|nr:serpin family protein [Acidimicrobiales bacterium]